MCQIDIDTIGENGLRLDRELRIDQLPLLHRFCREEKLYFPQPVTARLHAQRTGDTVTLTGRLASAVNMVCSRCLVEFELPLKIDFSTTAIPEQAARADLDTAEEIELEAAEMDLITYQGTCIDIKDELAQQVIMGLPFNPLCSPECKGLCSSCGVNLNEVACKCPDRNGSNPFSVLKQLSFPEGKA